MDIFEEIKQSELRSREDKEYAKIIWEQIKDKGTNERFPTYKEASEEILRFIKRKLKSVSSIDLNKHSDVSPCKNGCVYHLRQPPFFAPGMPKDLMVKQYALNYVPDEEEITVVPQVNLLFHDLSSRSMEEMTYLLSFLASGTIAKPPGKQYLLFADLGDTGKSAAQALCRASLSPKYVVFITNQSIHY